MTGWANNSTKNRRRSRVQLAQTKPPPGLVDEMESAGPHWTVAPPRGVCRQRAGFIVVSLASDGIEVDGFSPHRAANVDRQRDRRGGEEMNDDPRPPRALAPLQGIYMGGLGCVIFLGIVMAAICAACVIDIGVLR